MAALIGVAKAVRQFSPLEDTTKNQIVTTSRLRLQLVFWWHDLLFGETYKVQKKIQQYGIVFELRTKKSF